MDPKKLAKMYEEYLRENLEKFDREEMIEQFIATVLGFIDFNNPAMSLQIAKLLLKHENKKKAMAAQEEVEKALSSGEDEAAPESNPGEELDFSSMSKPSNFDEAILYLSDLTDVNDSLDLEDQLNAVSVIKSVRKYMFNEETPWMGILDDTLCLAWSANPHDNAIISFIDGHIFLEFTHRDESYKLELNEDGLLEYDDIKRIMAAAYELQGK